jgi:hypothetical protein
LRQAFLALLGYPFYFSLNFVNRLLVIPLGWFIFGGPVTELHPWLVPS